MMGNGAYHFRSLFGVIAMGFAPLGSILYGVSAHYVGAGPSITGGAFIASVVAGGAVLAGGVRVGVDHEQTTFLDCLTDV